ncbi:serine/threonine-protein kinase [Lentzea flava]|uniref:non-specific serine/threonine protein kinase n=1 Tax=Lentzea flava TaxID=103732 RepID=A0ABQ2UGG7_9PSEU|nr:serine/threonine-protein kinase [Lentzea flava]MCP2201705.1 Serine/threonine protein kinase [Lentzea flava]GGU28103.1 serine/threonine protein kinase [Lentzea flava]
MPDRRLLADRYRLGEVLGTGGVAEVRRARDVVLARDVAVKLFRRNGDMADVRRFDNEIRTLATLSHPGLVTVYDADTSGDTPFMVLELVDGRTLRDHLANGPMEVGEVRRLGAALADALAHVHDRGFVHRDVKPSNILLDDDDTPRLADFGLARLVDGARFTRADQVVGTAAYLAPEQVRGGEITPAVDVYALGLVLLECLTGHREYEGAEIEAAVARLHRPPVIPDDLPFDLARLLSLMTALPAGRRPTARECADILRGPGTQTLVAPVPRRHRGVLAAASAAVLAAAVGIGLVVQNQQVTPAESAPPQTTQQQQQTSTQPAPVVEQPVVSTVVQPPVQANNEGKGKPGKGKGKGKP